MADKFEKKTTKKVTRIGTTLNTITITRKGKKKMINAKDIQQMAKELTKKLDDQGKEYKVYLRTLNINRWHTFNIDDEGAIENFATDEDDYYNGKVKNDEKFLQYGQVKFNIEIF